jgi:very-short-patch-repair endonuclease
MKNKNLFNRKSLKFFRSSLRNKSTSAEADLWNILKSKKLNARKFRRQHRIIINQPPRPVSAFVLLL